ncbi:hypothetical protein HDU67_005360 [Dinochytrium kinnereticum]|nr:hypothetical protein HDU67_005360 [Dinochytrium kinnereticum]
MSSRPRKDRPIAAITSSSSSSRRTTRPSSRPGVSTASSSSALSFSEQPTRSGEASSTSSTFPRPPTQSRWNPRRSLARWEDPFDMEPNVAIIERLQEDEARADLDAILSAQLQREEEENLRSTYGFEDDLTELSFTSASPRRGFGGMFGAGRLPSLPVTQGAGSAMSFGFDDETPVDRLMRRLRAQSYLETMHREVMGGEEGESSSAELILRLMEAQTDFGRDTDDGDMSAIMDGILGGPARFEGEDSATYESLLSLAEEVGPAVSRGAPPAVVARLPRRVLERGDRLLGRGAVVAEQCAICLEEFKRGDKVMMLHGCSHQFHDECGGKWFEMSKQCPTCRVDFTESMG